MTDEKDKWIKVRVTAEEKRAYTKHAEDEGRTLSSWVRQKLKLAMQSRGKEKKAK